MRQRIHDTLLGVIGLAGVGLFALSGASCERPQMPCAVGHYSPYFFKYEFVSGDASCYPGDGGEEVGMSTFLGTAGTDKADYDTRNLAIQSTTMGLLLWDRDHAGNDENDKPYAFGPFTSSPDDSNLCYAGGANGTAALASADMDIDAFDTGEDDGMGGTVVLPAIHWRQEWKNVRLFVTEGVPGTQAVGEMHFEDVTAGCFADYKFVAIHPGVPCGNDIYEQVDNDGDPNTAVENDTDDDGDPTTPVENDDDDPDNPDEDEPEYIRTETDEALCDPKADPDNGRVYGSGINPDFKTRCDPDLFYCVLAEKSLAEP